jgi:hypothetical protein
MKAARSLAFAPGEISYSKMRAMRKWQGQTERPTSSGRVGLVSSLSEATRWSVPFTSVLYVLRRRRGWPVEVGL